MASYPKSGTKAKITKPVVTVFHAPPPSPDRPAQGIVQPDHSPQGNTSYHGEGPGKAPMPKGGGLALGYTSAQPQETE